MVISGDLLRLVLREEALRAWILHRLPALLSPAGNGHRSLPEFHFGGARLEVISLVHGRSCSPILVCYSIYGCVVVQDHSSVYSHHILRHILLLRCLECLLAQSAWVAGSCAPSEVLR